MTGRARPASCSGNGDCIEVCRSGGRWVWMHTSDPLTGSILLTSDEWDAFVAGIKAGKFDDLSAPPAGRPPATTTGGTQ